MFPVKGFQFQGSLNNDMKRLFGLKISKAMTEGPVYKEKLANGMVAIRCVNMSFIHNPQDDGVLNLSLGLTGGLWRKNTL